jgi:hypothetical protein
MKIVAWKFIAAIVLTYPLSGLTQNINPNLWQNEHKQRVGISDQLSKRVESDATKRAKRSHIRKLGKWPRKL